jgi:hypothetical protein
MQMMSHSDDTVIDKIHGSEERKLIIFYS